MGVEITDDPAAPVKVNDEWTVRATVIHAGGEHALGALDLQLADSHSVIEMIPPGFAIGVTVKESEQPGFESVEQCFHGAHPSDVRALIIADCVVLCQQGVCMLTTGAA